MSEMVLMAHPTFAVLGIICAVWVIAETMHASPANLGRIRVACAAVAVLMVLTWVVAGYWYVGAYAPEKAIILKGPWAFAHNFVMETKEHFFFATLVLALFLPIAARGNLVAGKAARSVVLATAGLIIVSSLVLEGAGGTISMGVKVGLLHTQVQTAGQK